MAAPAQCPMSSDKWFDPSLVIGGQGRLSVTIDTNLRLPTQTVSVHAAPRVTSMVSTAKDSESAVLESPNGMSDNFTLGCQSSARGAVYCVTTGSLASSWAQQAHACALNGLNFVVTTTSTTFLSAQLK